MTRYQPRWLWPSDSPASLSTCCHWLCNISPAFPLSNFEIKQPTRYSKVVAMAWESYKQRTGREMLLVPRQSQVKSCKQDWYSVSTLYLGLGCFYFFNFFQAPTGLVRKHTYISPHSLQYFWQCLQWKMNFMNINILYIHNLKELWGKQAAKIWAVSVNEKLTFSN